jgi:hypothetical protein
MNWKPITHSDSTDMPAPLAAAPLDFELSDADLAHAAAARYHLRQHVERLNAQDTTHRRKKTR